VFHDAVAFDPHELDQFVTLDGIGRESARAHLWDLYGGRATTADEATDLRKTLDKFIVHVIRQRAVLAELHELMRVTGLTVEDVVMALGDVAAARERWLTAAALRKQHAHDIAIKEINDQVTAAELQAAMARREEAEVAEAERSAEVERRRKIFIDETRGWLVSRRVKCSALVAACADEEGKKEREYQDYWPYVLQTREWVKKQGWSYDELKRRLCDDARREREPQVRDDGA
jgi:hypothetical protein